MIPIEFEVRTRFRTYPVYVGDQILGRVGEFIGEETDKVFVITVKNNHHFNLYFLIQLFFPIFAKKDYTQSNDNNTNYGKNNKICENSLIPPVSFKN